MILIFIGNLGMDNIDNVNPVLFKGNVAVKLLYWAASLRTS